MIKRSITWYLRSYIAVTCLTRHEIPKPHWHSSQHLRYRKRLRSKQDENHVWGISFLWTAKGIPFYIDCKWPPGTTWSWKPLSDNWKGEEIHKSLQPLGRTDWASVQPPFVASTPICKLKTCSRLQQSQWFSKQSLIASWSHTIQEHAWCSFSESE